MILWSSESEGGFAGALAIGLVMLYVGMTRSHDMKDL
jgi:hypothetical protein